MKSLFSLWLLATSLHESVGANDNDSSALTPTTTRVFILAGDAEGKAHVSDLDISIDDPLTNDKYGHLISDEDKPVTIVNGDKFGPLSIGFGSSDDLFGPELQFGHHVADFWKQDSHSVIVKIAVDDSSLAVEWRPPSSPSPKKGVVYEKCDHVVNVCTPHDPQDFGSLYKEMIDSVKSVLQDLDQDPNMKPELAAFIWSQGSKDVRDVNKSGEYKENLKHLVSDVRRDLNAPHLPAIISEHGAVVNKRVGAVQRHFARIQKEAIKEIEGPIAYVHTNHYLLKKGRWYDRRMYDRADTTLNIGRALAEASIQLNNKKTPQRHRRLVKSGDKCSDDPFAHFFVAKTGRHQTCKWLAKNFDKSLCDPNEAFGANTFCPETCGACVELDLDALLSAARPDSIKANAPTKEALSQRRSLQSTEVFECDDSKDRRFWVDSTQRLEPCVWLSARPAEQAILCPEGHPSRAREVCPETCGACVDTCEDTTGTFMLNGVARTCLFLSLRNSLQQQVCNDATSDAATVCPETCDTCDVSAGTNPIIFTDVIIAGAGTAGMNAATTLTKSGITNFYLAEASNRIGGRMYTKQIGVEGNQHRVNVGTSYVDGTSPSPYRVAQILANFTTEELPFFPFRYFDEDGNLRPEENDFLSGSASLAQDTVSFLTERVILECLRPGTRDTLSSNTQSFCATYLGNTDFAFADNDDISVADLYDNIFNIVGRANDTTPSFSVPASWYYYQLEEGAEPENVSANNSLPYPQVIDYPPDVINRNADSRDFNFLVKFLAADTFNTSVRTDEAIEFNDDRLQFLTKVVEVRWDPTGEERVEVVMCRTELVVTADRQDRYPCTDELFLVSGNEFMSTWTNGVIRRSIELELNGTSFADSYDIAPRFYPSLSSVLPEYTRVHLANDMDHNTPQYLQFNTTFWPSEEVFLSAFSDAENIGNVAPFWWNHDREGQTPAYFPGSHLMLHFSASDRGATLDAMSDEEIIATLLPVMNSMFTEEIAQTYGRELQREDVLDFFSHRWSQDPLFYGCWGSRASGSIRADFNLMATPCFGNYCISGDHTCYRYRGYVAGGHFAGERTATYILRERYGVQGLPTGFICDFDIVPFTVTSVLLDRLA